MHDGRITEHTVRSTRHCTAYLQAGAESDPLVVLVHGWPERAISWRHQINHLAELGYLVVAPDMRGYGNSELHAEHRDCAIEEIVGDMLELLGHFGRTSAIWIGHDWGSPVVWSIASHHPEAAAAVASLCVPYHPGGFTHENLIHSHSQWMVRVSERGARPADRHRRPGPIIVRRLRREGLSRNGFAGPASCYPNDELNAEYAGRSFDGGRLDIPVLFIHARYDQVCETLLSKLAQPTRASCRNLDEAIVHSGPWMAQEQPAAVNTALETWLSGLD